MYNKSATQKYTQAGINSRGGLPVLALDVAMYKVNFLFGAQRIQMIYLDLDTDGKG